MPLPKSAGGRPLPSVVDLVHRVPSGKADHGRAVFFRAGKKDAATQVSCGGCHRVQGQGEWVGPDLSTIGTKYGPDELIRSILNPSAAIGYSFRTLNVALKNGQVLSGLAVEDTADRLVLKGSDGKRTIVRPSEVEERSFSDLSLMPEGLAESMSDGDLVDLIAFLSTLRQPVSIVGQYQVIGPLAEVNGTTAFDTAAPVNLEANLRGTEGQKLSWRRLDANAEGIADLTTLTGGNPKHVVYAYAGRHADRARRAPGSRHEGRREGLAQRQGCRTPEGERRPAPLGRRDPAQRPERPPHPGHRRPERRARHDPRGGSPSGVPHRRSERLGALDAVSVPDPPEHPDMQLAKYAVAPDETPRVGLLDEGRLVPLGAGALRLTELLNADDVEGRVRELRGAGGASVPLEAVRLLAPLDAHEVWGAGVTYERSKVARQEESEQGGSFYDLVYRAARPELFFKATPSRVSGSLASIGIWRPGATRNGASPSRSWPWCSRRP